MIIDDLAHRSASLRRWLADFRIIRVPFPVWPLMGGPDGPAFHWTAARIPPGLLPEHRRGAARGLVPECPPAPAAQLALVGVPEERGFLLVTETHLDRPAPPSWPGLRDTFATLIGAPADFLPADPFPALRALGFTRLLYVTGISALGEGWPLGLRADSYQYFVRGDRLESAGVEALALAWLQAVAQESRRQGAHKRAAPITALLDRLNQVGPAPDRRVLDPLARGALPMLFGRGLELTALLNEVPPTSAALALAAQHQRSVSVSDLLAYFTKWLHHGLTVCASLTLLIRSDITRTTVEPPAGLAAKPPYRYERLDAPAAAPRPTP